MGKKTKDIKTQDVEETKEQSPAVSTDGSTGSKGKAGAGKPAEEITPDRNIATGLIDIDDMAEAQGLPGWEKAALFRAAGWSKGKKVSAAVFESALESLRKRQMGGGKL